MRIQSRYWDCMRGLVQQQFKVLAAAAARQEQLAAMKARRAEAATAAGAEEEEGESPRSRLCHGEEGEDAEVGALDVDERDEEDALLGAMHPHNHQRLHAAGLDGLDEETDTPHQRECCACW